MKISQKQLLLSAKEANIAVDKAAHLWQLLSQSKKQPTNFDLSKWLAYLGALIIFFAMSGFLAAVWDLFGVEAVLCFTFLYIGCSFWFSAKMWRQKKLHLVAELCLLLAICMVPIAFYSLQVFFKILNIEDWQLANPYFYYQTASLEIITALFTVITLYFFDSSLLLAPLVLVLGIFTLQSGYFFLNKFFVLFEPHWIFIVTGTLSIFFSYFIHKMKGRKYAFWGYLFGLSCFWQGFSQLPWNFAAWNLLFYPLTCIICMGFSFFLEERLFLIFGLFFLLFHFFYLMAAFFPYPLLISFIFIFLGATFIFLAVFYSKKNAKGLPKNFFYKKF